MFVKYVRYHKENCLDLIQPRRETENLFYLYYGHMSYKPSTNDSISRSNFVLGDFYYLRSNNETIILGWACKEITHQFWVCLSLLITSGKYLSHNSTAYKLMMGRLDPARSKALRERISREQTYQEGTKWSEHLYRSSGAYFSASAICW